MPRLRMAFNEIQIGQRQVSSAPNVMNYRLELKTVLAEAGNAPEQQLALFALLNLGLVESLASGSVSASDAVRFFFHAENCLFVRRRLRDRTADEVMSRGVQLPDLFEALPVKKLSGSFNVSWR
jgi:non-ribosomal peptide synthetase component E (peptide arylation enzyme)